MSQFQLRRKGLCPTHGLSFCQSGWSDKSGSLWFIPLCRCWRMFWLHEGSTIQNTSTASRGGERAQTSNGSGLLLHCVRCRPLHCAFCVPLCVHACADVHGYVCVCMCVGIFRGLCLCSCTSACTHVHVHALPSTTEI